MKSRFRQKYYKVMYIVRNNYHVLNLNWRENDKLKNFRIKQISKKMF